MYLLDENVDKDFPAPAVPTAPDPRASFRPILRSGEAVCLFKPPPSALAFAKLRVAGSFQRLEAEFPSRDTLTLPLAEQVTPLRSGRARYSL